MSEEKWLEDEVEDEEFDIDEYDLVSTPNDFNVLTINSFIESGAVKIPGFQRNFVWDIKRASKLIESLLLGLPVPQIFLYERGRNDFLVVDGQQRLMSIYYFIKQRFPRKEKRVELRRIFDMKKQIPREVLFDDDYFVPFKLSLAERLPDRPNRYKGLLYETLGDYRTQFDLRPIRNVIVKQSKPPEDDSSVFEIFSRLNTGGINLRPQEIRGSLYHSEFYDMLHRINLRNGWREIVQLPDPDLHMKDVEVLLRGFATLSQGHEYRPSMSKFLNRFSRQCQSNTQSDNEYLERLFDSFLGTCDAEAKKAFISARTKRFSIALYEAVFTVACEAALRERTLVTSVATAGQIRALDGDADFAASSEKASADKVNFDRRLQRARLVLRS